MSLIDDIENASTDDLKDKQKPWAEIGLDGGQIYTGVLDTPIADDWSPILRGFGLDPDVFEVVGDQVKMSKWQQSKRTESGDRDIVWLYAYKAVFRRKLASAISQIDIDEIRKHVRKWKPSKITKPTDEVPSTLLVCWADWQLYKSASGGVEATTARVLESFDKTVQRVKELRKLGRNIEGIHIVNCGDPIEACDGMYASQLFSVQGGLRDQLRLALDLWTQGVQTLAPLAEYASFTSCISNHGEWQRKGNKSMTTDSDSADGFLADALMRVLDGSDLIHEWNIPHDQMVMQSEISGVNVAFHHGHKMVGKEIDWLRGQSLKQLKEVGAEPEIWVTAHKHHLKMTDYGGVQHFQCPSLDTDGSPSGGSKWYSDTTAQWSTAPGTLTMLIGHHDPKKWSDLAVL